MLRIANNVEKNLRDIVAALPPSLVWLVKHVSLRTVRNAPFYSDADSAIAGLGCFTGKYLQQQRRPSAQAIFERERAGNAISYDVICI